MMKTPSRLLIGAGSLIASIAAVAEIAQMIGHWADRHKIGKSPRRRHIKAKTLGAAPASGTGQRHTIIVLGWPSRPDGSIHPVQRWRVKIARRSIVCDCDTRLVFTGFSPDPTRPSEAATMARIAKNMGVPDAMMVLEEEATSTWQNLVNTQRWMEDADAVQIASNPLHAWRARRFLRRINPRVAAKLIPARDYRFGEYLTWKLYFTAYEIIGAWREWRHPRLPG